MGASAPRKTGVELESLITEVKDLLPGLGDGFLEVSDDSFYGNILSMLFFFFAGGRM